MPTPAWREIPGPWSDEPDEWGDTHANGLEIEARRNSQGVWCGYVRLPEALAETATTPEQRFVVAMACQAEVVIDRGGLWAGFDCAHIDHQVPAEHPDLPSPLGDAFRTSWAEWNRRRYVALDEVKRRCGTLAANVRHAADLLTLAKTPVDTLNPTIDSTRPLKDQQQDIVELVVHEFVDKKGRPPWTREIADRTPWSTLTVGKQLENLAEQGRVVALQGAPNGRRRWVPA